MSLLFEHLLRGSIVSQIHHCSIAMFLHLITSVSICFFVFLVQEGETKVGREDAENQQDIGKG